LVILAVTGLYLPFRGLEYCRSHIEEEEPHLLETFVLGEALRTRAMDDHLVAAFLATPRDLDREGVVTLVCHFSGDSFFVSRVEQVEGDRLDRLKEITEAGPLGWLMGAGAWSSGRPSD